VLPLCFALPMLFKWGLKSTAIRLLAMYGGIFVAVGWWDGNPQWHDEIVGWGVLGGLALLVARGSGRGGMVGLRGRGLVDRVVGRGRGRGSSGPVVPRQGGGRVVGPQPFNAGGVTYVPVAVDRGRRAVRGVAGRVGRGSRHLEAVGGTAVRNVAEGRLPWRSRVGMTWINTGVWLETRLAQARRRTVRELHEDVGDVGDSGVPGYVPSWVRAGQPEQLLEADRLRRDVDQGREP
jgi:hypothetical protein